MALQQSILHKRYALEILESTGNQNPSQADINIIERLLKRVESNTTIAPRSRYPIYQKKIKQKGKILLIEDQRATAFAHSVLLKNLGFAINHIADAQSVTARELLSYNAIIVSENLPCLNAQKIVPHLKAMLNQLPQPKILVLTGDTNMPEEKNKLFLDQNIALISKPTIFSQLLKTLRSMGL